MIERTEEVLIGTKRGVVKCWTVERLDIAERWDKNNILEMVGTPWEPVPGKDDQHIPVDIVDNGEYMGSDSENEEMKADDRKRVFPTNSVRDRGVGGGESGSLFLNDGWGGHVSSEGV